MFHQLKKMAIPALVASSLAANAAPAFSNDVIWQANTDFDGILEFEAYDDNLYFGAFRNCYFDCVTTIGKHSMDGDLVWELEPEQLGNESYPSIQVNELGVFVAAEKELLKYSHDGELEWHIAIPDDELPLSTRYFLINSIALDEDGIYLSLGLNVDIDEPNTAFVKVDYDGSINWLTLSPGNSGGYLRYHDVAMAVKDGIVYVGDEGNVHLLNTDGELLVTKSLGVVFNQFEVADDGIIASSYRRLYKLSLSGAIEWIQPYYYDDKYKYITPTGYTSYPTIFDIEVKDGNIYVSGGNSVYRIGAPSIDIEMVSVFDLSGELKLEQALSLPDSTRLSREMSVAGDRLFLTTSETYTGNDFSIINEIAFNGTPPVAEEASITYFKGYALGDINNDGYQDIGVVTKDDTVSVSIKSIGTDANLNSFFFKTFDDVADVKVLADQNSNNAPEVALLPEGNTQVEIRDSLTGDLVNEVVFNSNVSPISPIKINFVSDLNNNGSAEVALLGSFTNARGKVVMVKDSASGELLHTVYFNPNFAPKDFAFVEDIDGDAIPEVAVLSTDSNNTSKFEIRSLNGEMIKNIWLGKSYNSTQLVTLPAAVNNEPTLATALGALQTKVNGNGLTVRMMDTQSGTEIQSVNYNSNFNPITAKAISDINSNGTSEIAVLGSNTDSSTGETSTKIEVKDSYSGNLVKNIWQNKTVTPIDLTIVADINGNGSPETVTLVEQNDSYKAIVKDSLTGELLDTIAIELE